MVSVIWLSFYTGVNCYLNALVKPISVNGITIKKGTQIQMPIWAAHHNKDFFPEPEVFKPGLYWLLNLTFPYSKLWVIPSLLSYCPYCTAKVNKIVPWLVWSHSAYVRIKEKYEHTNILPNWWHYLPDCLGSKSQSCPSNFWTAFVFQNDSWGRTAIWSFRSRSGRLAAAIGTASAPASPCPNWQFVSPSFCTSSGWRSTRKLAWTSGKEVWRFWNTKTLKLNLWNDSDWPILLKNYDYSAVD